VAVQNTREWRTLCGAVGDPALADDPRFLTNSARVHHSDALDALLGGRIRRLPGNGLVRRLEDAGLAEGGSTTCTRCWRRSSCAPGTGG
jgi:itaconate CoA-transferase